MPTSAVVINSAAGPGTYTIPSWAKTMKAWVIGGGGGGTTDLYSSCTRYWDGCNGGEAVKTYSVTGGETVSYVLGSGGTGDDRSDIPPRATAGTDSTFTYNGSTITATGGGANSARIPGNPNCSGGNGIGGDFNRTFNITGGIAGPLDFHGRLDAVALSGSVLNAGFGGFGNLSVGNGQIGGIVLCFTDDIPGVIDITNIRIAESFSNGDKTFVLTLGGQTRCCLLKYKLIPSGSTTTSAPGSDEYKIATATCNGSTVTTTINVPAGTDQVCFRLSCGCCESCYADICITITDVTTTTTTTTTTIPPAPCDCNSIAEDCNIISVFIEIPKPTPTMTPSVVLYLYYMAHQGMKHLLQI